MQRVRKQYWGAFTIGAVLVCLLLAAQWHTVHHPPAGLTGLKVFGSFWDSGWAARHGVNPYIEGPLTARLRAFGDHGPGVPEVNMNPPVMLMVFSLFTRLSPQASVFFWTGLLGMLLLGIAAVLVHRGEVNRVQALWLLTSGASVGTIAVMQDYELLLLLALATYYFLRSDQDDRAGICMGILVAIKPNFALWPLFLALSGRRKPIPATLLTCLALCLVPIPLYGLAVYGQWLHAAANDLHWLSPQDASIAGLFGRMGLRGAGIAISLLTLAALALMISLAKPNTQRTSGVALCAAILCAPIGWMEFSLVLFPLTIGGPWTKLQTVAMTILWIPPFLLGPSDMSHWKSALVGVLYCLALWLLLVSFAGKPARNLLHGITRARAQEAAA